MCALCVRLNIVKHTERKICFFPTMYFLLSYVWAIVHIEAEYSQKPVNSIH